MTAWLAPAAGASPVPGARTPGPTCPGGVHGAPRGGIRAAPVSTAGCPGRTVRAQALAPRPRVHPSAETRRRATPHGRGPNRDVRLVIARSTTVPRRTPPTAHRTTRTKPRTTTGNPRPPTASVVVLTAAYPTPTLAVSPAPEAPLATTETGHPARHSGAPAAPRHSVAGISGEPVQIAAGKWGVSLSAATRLSVPIAFGVAVAIFVLLQALVDQRDPKLSRAPERGDDDTVGFG